MPINWIPRTHQISQQIDEEEEHLKQEAETPTWLKPLQWIAEPFVMAGQAFASPFLATPEMRETRKEKETTDLRLLQEARARGDKEAEQAILKRRGKEAFQTFRLGGELRERYEELPLWQQMLAETPAIVATGGLSAAGLRATLLTKGTRVSKVGAAALKPLATVEEAPVKLIGKLKGALDYALKTRQATKALQKAGMREKALGIEEAFSTPKGRESYYQALKALKGKLGRADFEIPAELKLSPGDTDDIINQIIAKPIDKFDKLHAQTGIMKLSGLVKNLETGLPEQLVKHEIDILRQIFPELEPIIRANQTLGAKMWATFADVANIPRSLLASGDFSITARQGALILARHPQFLPGTLKTQLKVVFSPKNYDMVDDALRANPKIQRFLDNGLWFMPTPGKPVARLWAREETFMSNIAERLPFLGKFVRASERAFSGGGNYLRGKSAERYYNMLEKMEALTDDEIAAGARLINAASGRGSLPEALKGAAPVLNALMFSPRYVFSRFEVPAILFNPASSPIARKEAFRTLVQFMGFGTGIVSMAVLAGAKTELNPRSSDFGKITIGNTRLDIWAGYVQWARFLSQLATNERKITGTGETQKLNRLQTVWRMMQSKGSPMFSIMVDLLAEETYVGEPMFEDPAKRIRERLTPLAVQDLLDAIETDGLMGGLVGSAGVVGVGVVSYPPKLRFAPPFKPQKPKEFKSPIKK